MTVDNRLTAGFLHRIPSLEITIGSLAGDGYLRSDWGGSAGDRQLKVLQAKDTTWGGKFWTTNPNRIGSLIVAPGANSAGTLTLSATHEAAESTEAMHSDARSKKDSPRERTGSGSGPESSGIPAPEAVRI